MRELYITFSNSIFFHGRHINHFLEHWEHQPIWPESSKSMGRGKAEAKSVSFLGFAPVELRVKDTLRDPLQDLVFRLLLLSFCFVGILRLGEGTGGNLITEFHI